MTYRELMEKQTKETSIAIDKQTFDIVASQKALAQTFETGFDRINGTLNMSFSEVSNQLGYMTATFSSGLGRIAHSLERMSNDICKRLDNPYLIAAHEQYTIARNRYSKGLFVEALESVGVALDKDKTYYMSWFLLGEIYLLGANEFGNVIDLDAAIDALKKALRYIHPDIGTNEEAGLIAARIWFYLGLARFNKYKDLSFQGQGVEAKTTIEEAVQAFEESYGYSKDILEARYNVARCKALMGNTKGALYDLEIVMTEDRNYCLKVFCDSDFDSMHDDCIKLIERMKHFAFVEAEIKYNKVKNLVENLESMGGSFTEAIPSKFIESIPYFDVLDYNVEFGSMLGRIETYYPDRS